MPSAELHTVATVQAHMRPINPTSRGIDMIDPSAQVAADHWSVPFYRCGGVAVVTNP